MTRSIRGRLYELQLELHQQFERQTDQLADLTGHRGDDGSDPQTVASLKASTRQALADTTEALQRMNDGTYGRCQHCGQEIPVERLGILPSARYCVPCQQIHRG